MSFFEQTQKLTEAYDATKWENNNLTGIDRIIYLNVPEWKHQITQAARWGEGECYCGVDAPYAQYGFVSVYELAEALKTHPDFEGFNIKNIDGELRFRWIRKK